MNGKRAVKKSQRNYPAKKSIRLVKERVAAVNKQEQLEQ